MKDSVKKYGGMILRILIAGLLLWWVARGIKTEALARLSWRGILFSYIGSLLLIFLQTSLTAIRWRMLLNGQGILLDWKRAISLTFQGAMFSLFMPGGAVGGDILKAAFLVKESEKGKVEGITTIFLDRVIGMLGLFGLVLCLSAVMYPMMKLYSPEIRLFIRLLVFVSLAGFAAGVTLLFQKWIFKIPFLAFLLNRADRICKGALSRILNSVETCRKDSRTLWKAFLMSFLILHPLLLLCGVLILYGITGNMTDIRIPVYAVALGNVASVAPGTPGGLGMRDKVTEVILEVHGIDSSAAALVPLIYTCAYVSVGLVGVLFFFADSFRQKKISSQTRNQSSGL